MNAINREEANKPIRRYDSPNANRNFGRTYREAEPRSSSDLDSSDRASDCNDSDYMTSYDEPPDPCPNQREEDIAEKLSALQLNLRRRESPILAHSPGADDTEQSIASIADSRFSCILAGRLHEGENAGEEQSLLNIAMNESKEKYEDSLDDVRGVSKTNRIERDSLEPQAANLENLDPNIQGNRMRKTGGVPRVVSNELVNIPIKIVLKKPEIQTEGAACLNSVLKDKNDNIREASIASTTETDKYESLMCEKERMITADIKSPNPTRTRFIEDCWKSTPKIGVNADTFGSEFMTDISDLSMLTEVNQDPELCKKKILKTFSQQFVEDPNKFTEKLLTLFEESISIPNSKLEGDNVSGVNLSRLTQEFRNICRGNGKRIEDESMPNFTLGQSYVISTPPASEELQNFSKLGGGKKIYRKTPRRVFPGTGNRCGTPNCKNPLHRGKANLDSPQSAGHDSTVSFEFWEHLCYEESPTKGFRSNLTSLETTETFRRSHEELIRRSNEQMASLDQSLEDGPERCKEALPDQENFSITSSKECQDHSNSMRQRFLENLSSSPRTERDKSVDNKEAEFHSKQEYFEIENSLATKLVEKRRKCFEEARKVFEKKDIPVFDNFVNTLAACVDYYDHAKNLQNHRNSLHCILECSEGPKSPESSDKSVSLQYVETVFLPLAKKEKVVAVAAPKTPKLVSKVSLYVPGSPEPSSSQKSPRTGSRRSAGRRLSPSGHVSVVSKKIRSPVSPVAKRNLRVAKPASHSSVPRTPAESTLSGGKRKSLTKSGPGIQSLSHSKLKSSSNSPSLMDVTNIKKSGSMPRIVVTSDSPLAASQKESKDCKMQLEFPKTETPEERGKRNKFFFTPENTPTYGKVRPKKKYFQTPRQTPSKNKLTGTSPSFPGSHRINYNTVQSPVGNYIRGTDPNFITNVRGKTNERMLTPRSKTPSGARARAKAISPILARSPRLSPSSSEASQLKFRLNSQRRNADILNTALCESDHSSNVGSESSTHHSPFPKVFYKPAPSVKMVDNESPRRRIPKTLELGAEEKIIYRHEGRIKSAAPRDVTRSPADTSTKDTLSSCDLGDVSLLHQRPAAKTNYLLKK